MKILVTGGAGYIGSHTIVELYDAGHQVVVIDSLVNSSEESLKRIEKIVGRPIPFYKADVRNSAELQKVFSDNIFDAVIHFAGLKAVGESVEKPLEYYRNNLESTLCLLSAMKRCGVKKLVFSSSATVYGTPERLPLEETCRTGVGITNPYGQTKFMIEQILKDLCVSDHDFEATILRYFNPVGAHKSGLIGEDPRGDPNNLLPYISQVAIGRLKKLNVFGGDWNTEDGTGVRDYIHVVDLAKGHVASINHSKPGFHAYNLATGTGVSVFQLLRAFESASGVQVPYEVIGRRPGDVAACYASPRKANRDLRWAAELSLEVACKDAWRWQSLNPNGYS